VAKQKKNSLMRYILIIFSLIITIWGCNNSHKEDVSDKIGLIKDSNKRDIDSVWMRSDFDSAVAVILNGKHKIMYNINLMDSIYAIQTRRKLSDHQFDLISAYLSGNKHQDYNPSDCFQPYHGFFFYKNGRIKARLAICFVCGTHFSQPKKNGGLNYPLTKQMFIDWKLPVYNWDDSLETAQSKIKYGDLFK
jgi:hypothetical protein